MAKERLQKILARAGIASRRKCEQLILDGRVTVDGRTVTKLGLSFDPLEQEIKCDGEILKREKHVYVLLYKPRGYVCSLRPARDQHSVLELVDAFSQRLFPVGRLDRDSEGLLLLTNDGDLSARITHPRYSVPKTYRVTVSGRLTKEQIGDVTAPTRTSLGKMHLPQVKVVALGQRRSELEVTLKEGRNREIRRVLAAKGIRVRRLIRTAIGPVKAAGLKSGQYRLLRREEVEHLRREA